MKHALVLLSLVSLLFRPLLADQSARFACQATQGFAWTGLSEVTRERIEITIHPDHLDVEHEFEINARSNRWDSPSQPGSLEITGTLNMEAGTIVTGLLLWNGNKILKGKLQSAAMARRKYEEVVERNVKEPPPPRDPAILEKVGDKEYALSVFPVSLNGSRKLRIRYLVPSEFRDGAHRIAFPHAFSRIATLTLKGGSGVTGYTLTSVRSDGSETTARNEDAAAVPISLDPEFYKAFQPIGLWETGSGAWLRHVTPSAGNAGGSRVFTASMRDTKGSPGYVAHYIFRPPPVILDHTLGAKARIVAVLASGSDSVRKEINPSQAGPTGGEHLRVFSREPLAEAIGWRLYDGDAIARQADEKPLTVRLEDGDQYARSFGNVPFYPLAKTMPVSLAAAWGFIDTKYALLALERDTLSASAAEAYARAGVPSLDPEDIFPADGKLDSLPLSAWMIQRNFDRSELLKPISILGAGIPAGIRWRFRDGSIHLEVDKAALGRGLRVSLHGMDGRTLKQWGSGDLAGGRLSWSPREARYVAGICVIRIVSGTKAWSARIILR